MSQSGNSISPIGPHTIELAAAQFKTASNWLTQRAEALRAFSQFFSQASWTQPDCRIRSHTDAHVAPPCPADPPMGLPPAPVEVVLTPPVPVAPPAPVVPALPDPPSPPVLPPQAVTQTHARMMKRRRLRVILQA